MVLNIPRFPSSFLDSNSLPSRKTVLSMCSPAQSRKAFVSVLLFYLSITLAQDTNPQTIFSLDIFSSQKPCAQGCFIYTFLDCFSDAVGVDIGCGSGGCTNHGALDNCYCRTDLQSAAQSYLTSCVEQFCTAGDSSIDISSAGSIYGDYCSSQGYPASAQATTTQESTQATTAMYVTVYRSNRVSSSGLAYSTVGKIWGCFPSFWCISKVSCLYSLKMQLFARLVGANTFLLQSLFSYVDELRINCRCGEYRASDGEYYWDIGLCCLFGDRIDIWDWV